MSSRRSQMAIKHIVEADGNKTDDLATLHFDV